MKRNKLAVAAVCTVALALSGCGLGGSPAQTKDTSSAAAQLSTVTDDQLKGTSITMARFFGDCDDTTAGVTDVTKATTECEAIQILTNKFVKENKWGITVNRLGGAAWASYYDGLNAALASSERPNLAIMHGSNLPDYASRKLLVKVDDSLGIDLNGATKPAKDAIAYDGANYGVPFDTHAVVAHLNMDLLKKAGLTAPDGTYKMPTTPEAFLADAETFKKATGKTFFDVALANDPMGGRLWMSLIWQQDSNFIDAKARTSSANSEQAKKALAFINELSSKGYADKTHDYDASQQSFLRGDSAIMYNGVWAVNQYNAQAKFNYQVTDAPQLFGTKATWANSHVWTVPVQQDSNPVKYRAAFELAKFLYANTGNWAVATGHMPSSTAAIDSEVYQNAPHRKQYLKTATEYGHMQPRLVEWPAIGEMVQQKLESTWLNGIAVDTALNGLQNELTAKLK